MVSIVSIVSKHNGPLRKICPTEHRNPIGKYGMVWYGMVWYNGQLHIELAARPLIFIGSERANFLHGVMHICHTKIEHRNPISKYGMVWHIGSTPH